MKIILSRKGFDAACGGVASPILPGGRMVSLPIPERPGAVTASSRTYGQIYADSPWPVGRLVAELTGGRVRPGDPAHLDPDLDAASITPRPAGWRPLFGQTGAAETHLRNQGVGPGDVFVFYGWFREVEQTATGSFRFRPGAPDRHVVFGWLQVGERRPVVPLAGLPAWAAGHPHHKAEPYGPGDCVYLATERLHVPGHVLDLPGAGVLPFHLKRVLTAARQSRSRWEMPAWFHPSAGLALSYHARESRWALTAAGVRLDTAKQGQEFVFDGDRAPEALAWVAELLR